MLQELKKAGLMPRVTVLHKVPMEEAAQAESDAISMCRAIRGDNCLNKDASSTYSPNRPKIYGRNKARQRKAG